MSKKIILGATTALAIGIGGYMACDAEEPDTDRSSSLEVIFQPERELYLRDNPSQRPTTILLAVDGMHIHSVDEGWIDTNVSAVVDLLAPDEAIPSMLAHAPLPEGVFDQIRLDVKFAGVEVDRRWYPLEIPSVEESGLKIHTRFCLVDGETVSLELEWDIDEALHWNEQRGYWLTPSLDVHSPPTCAEDMTART